MPIGQRPAGFSDEGQLADLDNRELARLHLRRLNRPSSGYTYLYGVTRQDTKIMYPLDAYFDGEVAEVATMINADMRPQEITKWLDEHVDQVFFSDK